MAERNTCSWNTFWLRKVFQVAKSFWLYENTSHEQALQWNKSMKQKISGMSRGKVLLWNETIFTKSEYYVNVNFFKLYTRSIFDLYFFFFFFFLMFYWMNYNFYSSVHKHRECRLNQQYTGCKSPKGQVKTGSSWTHVSYSKNGEKAIQCRFRPSPPFFV